MEQNVNPGLALIGLSGTGPRAEGNTSNEDGAELIGQFLSVANRLLGASPTEEEEVSCQAHQISCQIGNLNLKFAVNVMLKIFLT